jgi:hypothetical protein
LTFGLDFLQAPATMAAGKEAASADRKRTKGIKSL